MFFCVVGLAKRQWSGFYQTHKWNLSVNRHGEDHDKFWGVLRGRRVWITVELDFGAQLFSWWVWPDLGCSFRCLCVFYDCLRCRQGRNQEHLGCLRASWWGMCTGMRWRSHHTWKESRTGWVVGCLCCFCLAFRSSHLIHSHNHLLFWAHLSTTTFNLIWGGFETLSPAVGLPIAPPQTVQAPRQLIIKKGLSVFSENIRICEADTQHLKLFAWEVSKPWYALTLATPFVHPLLVQVNLWWICGAKDYHLFQSL